MDEDIVEDLYYLAVDELITYIKIHNLNLPGTPLQPTSMDDFGYDFKESIISSLESLTEPSDLYRVTADIKRQYNYKTGKLEYHMCYILTKRCCVYATALKYSDDEEFLSALSKYFKKLY